MPAIDLHAHSHCSDGTLSPDALVRLAAEQGCQMLALTDHDETRGLPIAQEAAKALGIQLVSGVEISVTWFDQSLHIVGLGIDPTHPDLVHGLASVRAGRLERAQRMSDALAKAGIPDALEGAARYAANPEMIGRTHFARYLVEQGKAKEVRNVFKTYLAKGKIGYVSHQWAALSDAIHWITQSGGIAVLAHPGRYPLSATTLNTLLGSFYELGGRGIEVVSSSHNDADVAKFSELARQYKLFASLGSDFHSPQESWRGLGVLPDLPAHCTPIWSQLKAFS